MDTIPEMVFAVFPHMVFRAVIGCVNFIFARFLVDSFLFVFGCIVSYTHCLFTNQRIYATFFASHSALRYFLDK